MSTLARVHTLPKRLARRLKADAVATWPELGLSQVTRASRFRLVAERFRARLPGSRPRDVPLRLRAGATVWVRTDTVDIDVATLDYALRGRYFPIEAMDRVVLDLGAHKGYVAVWCLLRGARAVYSLEPEPANLRCLLRTTVPRAADRWIRTGQAVGAADGRARLRVSSESWSHSLRSPPSGVVVDEVEVEVVALSRALDRVEADHPGAPLVIKLNVEGLAGECLLSVPPDRLVRVEQLYVDVESNTPHPIEEILAHLAHAGFQPERELDGVWELRRRKREICE